MKMKQYPKFIEDKNNLISVINMSPSLPINWQTHKIKFLLRKPVTDGPHETPEFIDEGIPFLSVDSIQDGNLVFENCRYISEEDHIRYKQKCNPKKNDVLMGKAASIGKIAIVDVDFEFSTWSPLALLRPDTKKILPKFLEYSLKSDYCQDQIDLYATSNTQKNISMDEIPRIQIITPTIEEQSKEIDFLDSKTSQISKTIEADKKLIELLKEKRTALINHVVTKGLNPKAKMKYSGIEWIGEVPEGWEVGKLKYSCLINKKTLGEETNPQLKINYLDISNVNNTGSIVSTEELYFEDAPSRARRVPDQKDTIISTVRTYLKAIAYLDNIPDKLIVSTGFAVLHADKKIMPKFLFYVTSSETFIQKVIADSTGVAYPAINPSDLGQIKIVLPSYPEQIQIAKYLDKATSKIDQTIKNIEEKIELLEEYKKSLIHHVVTGKVDVREAVA
ncbi:MAG: restriction endonuclease subunit S [Methanocellales archaeon]|nr:restriction endonuclease subunit S [Methanocellales archaeon]